MNINTLLLTGACLLLTACNSTPVTQSTEKNTVSVRPNTASDYQQDLIIPNETDTYILIDREVYDEPALGTLLRFVNKDFPEDNITLYVYPISATHWDNADDTLNQELDYVLQEIDMAINQGMYKTRDSEIRTDFSFNNSEISYKGKKTKLKLTSPDDVLYYSNTYLFIAEDKFIKFRTSFDSRMSKEINGDSIVEHLLPLIKVPKESAYMKNLRAEHAKKMEAELIQMLLQNALSTSAPQ